MKRARVKAKGRAPNIRDTARMTAKRRTKPPHKGPALSPHLSPEERNGGAPPQGNGSGQPPRQREHLL